jgi:CrcB protein
MMIPSAAGEFPTAVLVINLTGSFLLGLYLARRERTISRPASLQFWAIGLLGSFTTFSTFTVDVIELAATGPSVAAAYVALSMLGGLALALAGHRIGAASR